MDSKIFPIPQPLQAQTKLTKAQYEEMYRQSIDDPETFWADQARRLDWIKPFHKVKTTSFDPVAIRWFEDGVLNACYNCIDRHLAEKADQTAFIWESDDGKTSESVTYQELYHHVCRMANLLKAQGVKKGDRVVLYMPMILETAYAMLACARIGAVHSVVFAGFSPEALRNRIEDCGARIVITSDFSYRGGKKVPLKDNVDKALAGDHSVRTVIVIRRDEKVDIVWHEKRDIDYYSLLNSVEDDCPFEAIGAEDPLFILYTSGSTGKPKGILHTTGGYLLYASMTHEYVFDLCEGDIYWCTADFGWVTGHSYVLYGPLANGATSLLFEGVPTYPDPSRMWQIVDKHKVNIFYTAPTAIRALMKEGDEWVKKTARDSLRILGSVGEPINPEAWLWYYQIVGNANCAVVDTWWQTETGGILLTPFPGATDMKPGAASWPFFGVDPVLLDEKKQEIKGTGEGALCIKSSWPGQMRNVYGDPERFVETYFAPYQGYYFSGDGAKRDEDGYYWITGRMDDVLNISGHRLGTAEVESALVENPNVAEAAVVGMAHDIKGQGIYAFVTVKAGVAVDDNLKKQLIRHVREVIGPIATIDKIQWAPALPKTRSGKIMRRILRKIAGGDIHDLGDTSTLADPQVVDDLLANRQV